MVKFFSVLLLSQAFLFGQVIYYQNDDQLYSNGDFVKISYQHNEYFIFKGSYSPSGEFITGFLMTKKLKNYIQETRKPEITDFYDLDSLTFVVYSNLEASIVFHKEYDCFVNSMFSTNEDYIFIEDAVGGSIINLQKNELVYKIDESILDFRWVENELHVLQSGHNCYLLTKYMAEEARMTKEVIVAEQNTNAGELTSHYILDTSQVILAYKEKEKNRIALNICRDSVSKHIGSFYLLSEFSVFDHGILFLGMHTAKGEQILYTFTPAGKHLNKLFEINKLRQSFGNAISSISDIFKYKDKIIFITRSFFLEDENIFEYNIQTQRFKRLTQEGNISGPLGIFN